MATGPGLSRRALLAGTGGALVLGSGCLRSEPGLDPSGQPRSCGASGPIGFDDVLRVRMEGIVERERSVKWNAIVHQPGPGSPGVPDDRSEFNTSYEGVTFYAFDLDRSLVASRAMGEFESGHSESATFDTVEFPHVITASVGQVDSSYEGYCRRGITGADVCGYLGHHPEGTDLAGRDPISDRRLEPPTTGHIWAPVAHLSPDEKVPPPSRAFRRTRCLQRRAAGRDPDHPAFRLVPYPERWLRRRERYELVLYRNLGQAPKVPRKTLQPPPNRIVRLYEETDWEAMDDGEPPTIFSRRVELTRAEWKRAFEELEGTEPPKAEEYECAPAEHIACHGHRPAHCESGRITGDYRTTVDEAPSAIGLHYVWDGPRYPEEINRDSYPVKSTSLDQ